MAITGPLTVNKAEYLNAYIKVMSFNHTPNTEGSEVYRTFYQYNVYADSEKDVILCGGSSSYPNNSVSISFSDCYSHLETLYPGMADC